MDSSSRPWLTRWTDGARGAVRLVQVLGVTLIAATSLLPALARWSFGTDRPGLAGQTGRVISAALWRLGPAFVKLGQLLSTRQDLLPPALCAELQAGLARGRGGWSRYRTNGAEEPPTEIGSVASVHRRNIDGVDVAVKRIHPGAARQLEIDLGLLRRLTALLVVPFRTSPPPLPQIVDEMCTSIRRQTDLRAEAETLDLLGPLADTLPVVLPRVLHEHSDADQLVMTWVAGQTGDPPAQPVRTARRLVLALYEMLFVTGVVHCDLHRGNWWELADGRIAIVDAGFAYDLDDDMRSHFAEFFLGMASGNAEICATHALAACAQPVPPDRERLFRTDMTELIRTTTGLTAGDFSLARFAARFFQIQRRHQAYSRATFIYPFMALLAIEGQVKQFDPKLNFQSLSGPVVLRAIVNRARTGSSATSADRITRPAR